VPECATCQSYLCPRQCKNDAGRICVAPAVARYGAALLDECTVVRLEASRTAVDALVCHWQGRTVRLRGKIVVLAAGALSTPGILLNSTSADWPHGVANNSGMVGRNLMRHLLDLYVIALPFSGPVRGQIKEIGFNDFYHFNGGKYGNVQSFGPLPSMRYLLNRPAPNLQRRFLRHAVSLATPPWDRFRHSRLVLASILEDLPYAENRVLPAASANGVSRIKFQYTIHAHERRRQTEFRASLANVLKPSSYFRMRADGNTMLAHVCGTCRFGADPKSSVLDATNRAHDLSNLYVCDSSFFPSSAGINPALTVAANALRVAAHVQDRL
jgi:choline dehydrogenase-like flavoprotein